MNFRICEVCSILFFIIGVFLVREAIKCGKCVVIGLQSTGEARTLEQLERDDGELSDFVSTAKFVKPWYRILLELSTLY